MLSDIHTSEPSRCSPRISVCTLASSPFFSFSIGACSAPTSSAFTSWVSMEASSSGAVRPSISQKALFAWMNLPSAEISAMPMAAWVNALWKRLSLSFSSSTWRSPESLCWK